MSNQYWTLIPAYIYDIEELNSRDREIFGLLIGLSAKYGYADCGNEFLAKRLRCSIGSVKRSLEVLEKLSCIKRQIDPRIKKQPRKIYITFVKQADQKPDSADHLDPPSDQDDPPIAVQDDPQDIKYLRSIYRGKEFHSLDNLSLSKEHYDKLLVGWYHGIQEMLDDDLEAASDHLGSIGQRKDGDETFYFIKGWKRRSAEFKRPAYDSKKGDWSEGKKYLHLLSD